MKIGELLQALETENIATISKRIDGISEKPLRIALKSSGCEPKGSGKKGWIYTGDDVKTLEQSIFYYHAPPNKNKLPASPKPTAKQLNNVTTKPVKNEPTKEEKKETIQEQKNQRMNPPTKETSKQASKEGTNEETNDVSNEPNNEDSKQVIRKRFSFDLDIELMKQLKVHSVLTEKNVYEMVEDSIREYLQKVKK